MKKHYERTGEIKVSIDYQKKGVRQIYKKKELSYILSII